MLFESLKQGYIFFGSVYFGLIIGIIYDFCKFNVRLLKNKKVAQIIFDCFFSIAFVLLFFMCLNVVYFGEFRLFVLISFTLGFVLEQKNLGFLVDFIIKKLYNFFVVVFKRILKIKFIRRMFNFDSGKSKNINKNR